MKTISAFQRTINIINKALDFGLKFDESQPLIDIRVQAENLLEELAPFREEECPVESIGNVQRVDWSDGMGYEYCNQGEIVSYCPGWLEKIYHSTVIDSLGNVVKLFTYR